MTDFPEMTIASDNVDDIYIEKPHRWDVSFIRRFMLIFGSLSSLFDYLTFGLLLFVLKTSETQFQSAWFIESVLSAMLVVFFARSRPSRLMITVTLIIALAVMILPYSPLASVFGFTALPLLYLGLILVIVILYLVSAELTKRWFYRQIKNHG